LLQAKVLLLQVEAIQQSIHGNLLHHQIKPLPDHTGLQHPEIIGNGDKQEAQQKLAAVLIKKLIEILEMLHAAWLLSEKAG